MAEAVLKLFRNPDLRASLGENGRAYVKQHYNRVQIAERLEKLLMLKRPDQCVSGLQREGFHES